jgi:hypothetical protein
MLRLLAPLLVALLVTGCGDAPPAATSRSAKTTATPAPPPPPAAPQPTADADELRCGPARTYLDAVRSDLAANTDPLAALRAAYQTTALQELIERSDAATARQDDAAISAALAGSGPTAATSAQYAIHGAIGQWMRHNLKVAAESKDAGERAAAWTEARCVWSQHLRHLGVPLVERAATSETEAARDDATVLEVVDLAFTAGAAAVTADPIDDRALLPARQTVEKSWYRLVHRELAHHAALARKNDDPLAARRALGLFEMLRDRMPDKNTPGVAVVTAMLSGPAAGIDPAAVLREVDVALVKRARKYCSEAVDAKFVGTAAGLASVAEGAAYTRVLMPGLLRLPGFDATAHMAAWQAFSEAVGASESPDELRRLSDELVHWNCAYQQALGIRECTATADEVAARPK